MREPTQDELGAMYESAFRFSVPLFAIRDDNFHEDPGEYWGSGVLVRGPRGPYVLTAAHVWEKLNERSEPDRFGMKRFGMHVRPGDKGVAIPMGPEVVKVYEGPNQDGPDIALVPVPVADVEPIQRGKVFYNLEVHRGRVLDDGAPKVWAKYGAPGEHVSKDEEARQWVMGVSMYGQADAPTHTDRGGFDYEDVPSPRDGADGRPRSYAGLSGSGLWVFTGDETIDRWAAHAELAGVAFYQLEAVVRYHGRRSIYTILDKAT